VAKGGFIVEINIEEQSALLVMDVQRGIVEISLRNRAIMPIAGQAAH